MRVRICFNETGTGEDGQFETEIKELTLECVIDAFRRLELHHFQPEEDDKPTEFKGEAFIVQPDKAAFILSSNDEVWFGDVLWHGVVYTLFAGGCDLFIE